MFWRSILLGTYESELLSLSVQIAVNNSSEWTLAALGGATKL